MASSKRNEQSERLGIFFTAIFISSLSVISTFRLGHVFHTTAIFEDGHSMMYSSLVTSTAISRKPRILLGINCIYPYSKPEGKRRRMVRQSYLQFHRNINKGNNRTQQNNNRICSIPELAASSLSSPSPKDPNDCRIVYTFIFPNRRESTKPADITSMLLGNKSTADDSDERDVVHFKVSRITDSMEHFMVWMKFANRVQDDIHDGSLGNRFDYVAFASAEALIYPISFWNDNQIFHQYQSSVFAGMKDVGTSGNCQMKFCLNYHFLCLSQDLARFFSTHDGAGKFRAQPMNSFHPHVWNRVAVYQNESGTQVSWLEIEGVNSYANPPEEVMPKWDKYISSIGSDSDTWMDEDFPHSIVTSYKGDPRILVGIFCTNLNQLEKKRREMLRHTYLTTYTETDTKYRICSLQNLLAKTIEAENCQFAYTFVVGGNSSAPTEQIDTDDIQSIAISHHNIPRAEPDVLYLNIKENMNEGKSETWFRYATLIIEHELYFDYVAKMDTDTILFPHYFFVYDMAKWPRHPENVRIYGGEYNVKQDGTNRSDFLLGASYFNGPLYWMSPDIARFITTKCNRTALRTSAEDMTIGNYINSFPYTINRYQLTRRSYAHPFKEIPAFRKRFARYQRRFIQYNHH
ncbi:unnamed protein product [Cylindrotheca closterium]|uniref:Hexosyltransferase n=1 Tax=Cylindrotheca closterium TaxID=2856 RepID=A0AAD2G1A6_9STRA|nr:unnamed protein product [Cylindrotheca closterium]